jgi:hypothetical protein
MENSHKTWKMIPISPPDDKTDYKVTTGGRGGRSTSGSRADCKRDGLTHLDPGKHGNPEKPDKEATATDGNMEGKGALTIDLFRDLVLFSPLKTSTSKKRCRSPRSATETRE